jgi:hypothetical protein
MNKDSVAQNLACVHGHFHSEAENNVEADLSCIPMTLSLKRLLSMASIGPFLERRP